MCHIGSINQAVECINMDIIPLFRIFFQSLQRVLLNIRKIILTIFQMIVLLSTLLLPTFAGTKDNFHRMR